MFFVPLGSQPDLRAIKKRVVCAGSGRDFDVKQHLSVSVDVFCTIFSRKISLPEMTKGFSTVMQQMLWAMCECKHVLTVSIHLDRLITNNRS